MNPKLSHLIENCDIIGFRSSMDMVKNASLFQVKGVTYIKHYDKIIFAYDSKKKICEIDYNCSMTSNRMINRALSYFDLVFAQCIDVHIGDKMNHSGPLI